MRVMQLVDKLSVFGKPSMKAGIMSAFIFPLPEEALSAEAWEERKEFLTNLFGQHEEVEVALGTRHTRIKALRWSQNTNPSLSLYCVFLLPSGRVVIN